MKKLLLFLFGLLFVGGTAYSQAVTTDIMTAEALGVTATAWKNGSFSNKKLTSAAVYGGVILCAISPHKNAIQLNGGNTGCYGINTTASGGAVKEIRITWSISTTGKNEQTDNAAIIIYGSDTAYSATKKTR